MNECPFPKVVCSLCGKQDRYNKIICSNCLYDGIKIVEKYYEGNLTIEDVEDIMSKRK